MRITNNIVQRNALAGLQTNLRRMLEAQDRVTTGRRITTPSDDPIGAAQVMQSGGSIRALDQYKRNIESARGRMSAEENVLNRLTDLISRAKQLGVQEGGSTSSATTRAVAKAEIDQLREFAVGLGNTKHEGEYLFGGVASNVAPFTSSTAPFTAAAPSGTRQTEISAALFVLTNHNGSEVFLDTNVMGALASLSDALGANDPAAVRAAVEQIDGAFAGVQNLLGDTGARSNQLDVTASNIDALDTQLRSFTSTLSEADLEEAITELVTRQTAYQAAMSATSRVIGLNLADYLR